MRNPNYDFHDLGKYTDEELECQITEGFIFGDYDSRENNMFLISRDAPTPSEKEITESVPYMQGVYDFSILNGDRFFDNREITYQLILFDKDYSSRKDAEHDLKRELMALGTQNLFDTHDFLYKWIGKCKSVTVEDDAEKNMLTATVIFDCYPFAIAKNAIGSDIWDDVYFPDWLFQDTSFSVSGRKDIALFNSGSKSIESEIVVTGNVTINGDFGTLSLSAGSYRDVGLVLPIGKTNLTLSGAGSVAFNFYLEVMI